MAFTVMNRGYCFWCGEKAEDYRETDHVRFYVCNKEECQNKPTKNYLFIINQFSELKNVAISHIKNNERNKGSLGFSHT